MTKYGLCLLMQIKFEFNFFILLNEPYLDLIINYSIKIIKWFKNVRTIKNIILEKQLKR